jgi:hypothetical protein
MMCRGWLLAGCLATAIGAQAQTTPVAGAIDPERQLQAIRDALIEKTLAAPVRVQSYGWIDTEGRLHESTQFSSDTQVRGVRVQAYVEDVAAPVRVQVEAHTQTHALPSGLGPRAEADPQRCLATARRWRQALHVETALGEALVPASVSGLAPMTARVQQAFIGAARESRRWVAQSRPAQPVTAYEQALSGSDLDRTEWLARIELSGSPVEPMVRIEVAPLHQPTKSHRVSVSLWGLGTTPQALIAVMSEALASLERQSACEPLWYAVAGQGEQLYLREGVRHGLQPGDRLLLVERQHLPARLLEPGAARALALVQVGMPSAQGTPLRWLAGPRPAQAGDWVVLPL